jgi:hypothetical protein
LSSHVVIKKVMQPLSSLSDACSAAEYCAMQLEDALVARQNATKEPIVLVGPWYERMFGPFYCSEKQTSSAVTYWRTQLKLANQKIAALQVKNNMIHITHYPLLSLTHTHTHTQTIILHLVISSPLIEVSW